MVSLHIIARRYNMILNFESPTSIICVFIALRLLTRSPVSQAKNEITPSILPVPSKVQQSSVPSQPQLLVPHLSAPSHSVSFLQLPSPTKHCPWIRLQQLSPFAPMQGFRHFILEPQTLGDVQFSSVEQIAEEQIYQSPFSS